MRSQKLAHLKTIKDLTPPKILHTKTTPPALKPKFIKRKNLLTFTNLLMSLALLVLLKSGSLVSKILHFNFLDEEYRSKTCVDLSKKDHDYYFGSYSHFYIHEEMLKDTVRTRSY